MQSVARTLTSPATPSLYALGWLVLMVGACSSANMTPDASHAPSPPAADAETAAATVVISPRSLMVASYPCSTCHDVVAPPARSGQTAGQADAPLRGPHRAIVLRHMSTVRDCTLCHAGDDLDQLRLLDDTRVPFDEAHEVCGQCHADRKQDWEIGIHGKQVGSWRGLKHRYACTQCHDPHAPARSTMTAYPPPRFPAQGIPKHHGDDHTAGRSRAATAGSKR